MALMKHSRSRISWMAVVAVQVVVVAAFGTALANRPGAERSPLPGLSKAPAEVVHITRNVPLRVTSLYDAPEMISDAQLAAVLKQVRPKFKAEHLKPNFVEHALRIWGVDAKFADPAVMSGADLKEFLVNHGKFLASWGESVQPLLVDEGPGVSIRWDRKDGGSVHHDHWLASLTEAGIHLDDPVFTPSHRQKNINDVLQQALSDIRLDERETEWSAMAFGLWLPPVRSWHSSDGRELSFDLLAARLLRGELRMGVCHGTHRLYSMMLLVRLDDEFHILSAETRNQVLDHLRKIRDLLVVTQFPDGHWPSDWPQGAAAVKEPIDDPLYRQIIATGHHLEWLALAPLDLHPPREQVRKAIEFVIKTTTEQPESAILEKFTFYSHVGGALSLWRSTRAADFWMKWESEHPQESAARAE